MDGGQDGIGATLGIVLGPVAYYFLAGALMGTAPWWGLVAALLFSVIGVAGAGTIVEGCFVTFVVLVLGVLAFTTGSAPPPLLGHPLLALLCGLLVGNVLGSIPFGLMGPVADTESLEAREDIEPGPGPEPPSSPNSTRSSSSG